MCSIWGAAQETDLPAFASAVDPTGTVLGIDLDEAALVQAAERTSQLAQVAVQYSDIHTPPVADRSVDRVLTDRVLQHVDNPSAVLAEARRVVKSDGLAVFAEPDWDTLVIDYHDPAVFHVYRQFVTDRSVRNAFIGRELPGLVSETGWQVKGVNGITAVLRDLHSADAVLGLHRVTTRAVDNGYLTADQAHTWLKGLRAGGFFASVTLFVVVSTPANT